MNNNVNVENGTAIQIITSKNHRLELNLVELHRILGSDRLKDHYVVVVSVTGTLRTGKSFLLNFFLKYLRAQVSKTTNNINIFFLIIFCLQIVCSTKHMI